MPKLQAAGYARLESSATPEGGEDDDSAAPDEIAELQRLVRKLEREVAASPEPEPETAVAAHVGARLEQVEGAGGEGLNAAVSAQLAELVAEKVAALTPRPGAEALSRDSVPKKEHQAALEKHELAVAEVAQLRQVLSSARTVKDDAERLRLLSSVSDLETLPTEASRSVTAAS